MRSCVEVHHKVDGNKKKLISRGKLGKYLKEQRGRMYIFRRCVVMLICWHE
ncbi:hypothetical protein Leryth_002574 [Lithospermum erythrorhizon]|nr:hypothetical protein Leryth_002574 [Lithospermum erythrorhizon]